MNAKNLTDKEKIDDILKYFQLNLAEFSRKLNVKTDTLYSVYFGKTKGFSVDLLRRIVKELPELSPYWLITGEGDMIASNSGIIQHHNHTATATQSANLDKLIELSASQQRTIEKLVNIINK